MLRWYEPVWLAFFAAAALKSTAVLALAWLIAKLLRGRSSAARHLVWTAAAAAVLALPFLSVSLMALWAAGTALLLAQMIFAFIAMARVRAKARRYAFEDFSDLADEMEIARPVRVLETAPGSMPMTFGLWRPAIF